MTKTIVICGYGKGISAAVAERFGREGFNVALVARSAEHIAREAARLESQGIRAAGIPADLTDRAQVSAMIDRVRSEFGGITVLHWNAYSGEAGDLIVADTASIHAVLELPVTALINCVQAALPELSSQRNAAILVTNGGLGLNETGADSLAVSVDAMGLALANAAKHKLVRLLSHKLKAAGIYVGEVMVLATVKGTSWDDGTAKLDASTVADAFYDLFTARTEMSRQIG
jgi:NAD(P)-dependent dehydrogenase (short-subunit alcohol dehydrogenase family)